MSQKVAGLTVLQHAVLQQDSAILWMDAQRSKPKRAWTELYQGWILTSLGLFLEVDYLHVQCLRLLNPKAVKAIHALLLYCTGRCCKYTGLLTSVSPCCHDQSVWTVKPVKSGMWRQLIEPFCPFCSSDLPCVIFGLGEGEFNV